MPSDINECMEANDCMQRCTNYPGGRNCSCFEGFQIDQADNTACIRKYHTCDFGPLNKVDLTRIYIPLNL